MNVRPSTALLCFLAVSALLARGANAQDPRAVPAAGEISPAASASLGTEPGPDQFGTNWFTRIIPATAFLPTDDLVQYSAKSYGYFGTRGLLSGSFVAPLDMPPGTEVQQVCLFVRDTSATNQIGLTWTAYRMGDATEASGSTSFGTVYSGVAATPGETVVCVAPASPVPIRAIGDVDGDGDVEYNYHSLHLSAPGDNSVAWGAAYVVWRRILSPAPATATFPSDVPTTHPFFRFVEALYASGITAGCGTGYCPDAPVTRGQMAVFLSAALGLYWPD